MLNYTKGEWKAVYHGWVDDGSKPIWFVETADDVICEIHDKANAQLISASPDLYEALKDALNTLDAVDNLYPTPNTQCIIKKALAKAEKE